MEKTPESMECNSCGKILRHDMSVYRFREGINVHGEYMSFEDAEREMYCPSCARDIIDH